MSKLIDPTKDNEDNEYNGKYKVTLKFINAILHNIEKEPIDDLSQFVDIDRLDLMKDVNMITLESMENEIFQYFDKRKCRYNTPSKNTVLNCLQEMLYDFGYMLTKNISNTNILNQTSSQKKNMKLIYSAKLMAK